MRLVRTFENRRGAEDTKFTARKLSQLKRDRTWVSIVIIHVFVAPSFAVKYDKSGEAGKVSERPVKVY